VADVSATWQAARYATEVERNYRAGMLGTATGPGLDAAALGAGGRAQPGMRQISARPISASKKNCLNRGRRLMWCIGVLTEQ